MTWILWVAGVLLVALFVLVTVVSSQHGYSEGYADGVYDIRQVLKEGKAVWDGSRNHHNQ